MLDKLFTKEQVKEFTKIKVIYIGLNPKIAKQVVSAFLNWQETILSILFL